MEEISNVLMYINPDEHMFLSGKVLELHHLDQEFENKH